jgi:cytochrome c
MRKLLIAPLVTAALGILIGATPAPAQDTARGKVVFEQCAACHSLDAGQNGVGPSLNGIIGRKSASEDFTYSPALKRANVVWTADMIDSYLADPQARADLIAFLGQTAK